MGVKHRNMYEASTSYLDALKDFVEGNKDLREWPVWWQGVAPLIEKDEGRTRYLKIKYQWFEGACQILERHHIPYQVNVAVNWNRCKTCGEPLFAVIPHVTTKEQIQEFARNSNLPDKENVERNGWIHPGTFCPNGCTALLASYRGEAQRKR
ncbi:MAG: hypothetical protein ACOYYS_06170 [Chloroflexota bacterium]